MYSRTKLGIVLFFLLIAFKDTLLIAQVGWKFEYVSSSYSHWKHLGSGDTTVIARLTFSQTDAVTYYLKQFTVRPLTNHPTQWFISRLILWKDNGNNRFDSQDTLISAAFNPATIPVQTSPQYALTGVSTNVLLQSNRYLFITAVLPDWHDTNPDNIEIDASSSGPDGYWFSVVDSMNDIIVDPTPTNTSINPYTAQHFQIVAQNLPVTIHNPQPSASEDDSTKLNMFFPRWEALNGNQSSRTQQVVGQEFSAEVYLPILNNATYKLESIEFDFGFDNNILELKEVAPATLWGNPASFFINDSLYLLESETYSNLSIWHYKAELINAANDTTNYRLVSKDTALLSLRFQVIKPGISPIFLQNIVARDFCGLRFHPYQIRQNFAAAGNSYYADKADAWAKFVLGDFTYPMTKSLRADNPHLGDGRVTWEDLTLFANHIWLNPSSSGWYRRFDIASISVHDPDELAGDDTTNFFDLLQITRNYYRTQNGNFAQKSVVKGSTPVRIYQHITANNPQQRTYSFALETEHSLAAMHWQLHFNPQQSTLLNIELADWVPTGTLFCYPPQLISSGILDLNFIFAANSTIQAEPFITLEFGGKNATDPFLTIDKIELYNNNFERLEWQLSRAEPPTCSPVKFGILGAFPNPFNSNVEIYYTISCPTADQVTLTIYDLQGRVVKVLQNGAQSSGEYALTWDGSNSAGLPVGSGLYFIRLSTANRTLTHKLLLLR